MKVPNNDNAIIAIEKIRDYLLSPLHSVGRYKAIFFRKIGYSFTAVDLLIDDFRKIIFENEIEKEIDTIDGIKYIVKGNIGLIFGISITVFTVWIIEKEVLFPCFVTAYPAPKKKKDAKRT